MKRKTFIPHIVLTNYRNFLSALHGKVPTTPSLVREVIMSRRGHCRRVGSVLLLTKWEWN